MAEREREIQTDKEGDITDRERWKEMREKDRKVGRQKTRESETENHENKN